MQAVRGLAAITAALTVVLIILGAAVRATNSGLSCPDWPTCYGHWVPLPGDLPPDAGYAYYQVMLEWAHRLLAGVIIGPLVLVVAALSFRRRDQASGLSAGAAALLLLLLVQAGLGGLTVLDQNSPWSVALHLGTALLVLTAMLFLVVRSRPAAGPAPGGLALFAWLAWFVTLFAMVSAAMVAKMGANLACSTWPDCDGLWLPDLSDPQVHAHVMHRLLAALAILAIVVLVVRARGAGRPFRGLATAALVLAILAAGLGGHGVMSQWPVWAAVVHQALAVLTFVHLTLLAWSATIPALGRSPTARLEVVG
jgi:heme A synthase